MSNSDLEASVRVHPNGLVETPHLGPRTRVWAFAHVLPGARIGADANICDHVFIENDVVLGDRVTVKSGVQLWDGMRVSDDVFIGPNAAFANDRFPRSKVHRDDYAQTVLLEGCSVGAGAVVLPGVTVGTHAMIGAGAVVTRNIPPYAIATGNPARISGYVDAIQPTAPQTPPRAQPSSPTHVEQLAGVRLVALRSVKDMRGSLSVAEVDDQLPFTPARCFMVHDVPSAEIRGEHAHHTLQQFLVCPAGSVNVVVDDGANRAEVKLDSPGLGLYIPPRVWATQYRYSPSAVLIVFASAAYDAADYIRDYDEFIALVG